MKYLKLQGWYGRLGNNIIQVVNMLHIALFHKYNIELPYHFMLSKQRIEIFEEGKVIKYIIDKNYYFIRKKIKDINSECFKENKEKIRKIMKDLFRVDYENILKKDKNSLVIHIRSGDIFFKRPSNPNYIMPPLSYYTNIIDKYKNCSLYLVAEDEVNPCVTKLLAKYPQMKYKSNFLKDDIEIILGSKNIVCSYGSFVLGLLLLNDNIEKIYYPSYQNHTYLLDYLPKIKHFKIDLQNYKDLIGKWKNTKKQQELMIDYI